MPRTRPPYRDEFRDRTVALVRASGRPLPEIAEELGVSTQTVRNWVKQADLDTGARTDGLSSDDKQELARLRRENKRLHEEREILRKAAAFFANETR